MIYYLLVGGMAVLCWIYLTNYAKKNGKDIKVWQWILTALGIIYAVFVLVVIYGFAIEREPQAALIMGLILGIVAVIWAVLMGRFVFAKKA